MKIILRRSLTGVAESSWNRRPDVHGISGRIAVDWVAECAWNQWPNDRGIRIEMLQECGNLNQATSLGIVERLPSKRNFSA